jgi:glycosyltransferase involved in cell wall biosynthesis
MPRVDIIIPVYNEEQALVLSIGQLRDFCLRELAYDWNIVIADNGSSDATGQIGQELARELTDVRYLYLPQKGRGRALRKAWLESPADIVCYMDVDLSTRLEALPRLLDAIAKEGYDLASGSRVARGSRTTRSFRREVTSRGYIALTKALFWNRFGDAQCGFKAASRRAVQALVPLVKDNAWFFDTELLLLAEMAGFRVKDIPITWVEDPTSTVKVFKTAWEDIKGLLRVRFRPPPGLRDVRVRLKRGELK